MLRTEGIKERRHWEIARCDEDHKSMRDDKKKKEAEGEQQILPKAVKVVVLMHNTSVLWLWSECDLLDGNNG